MSREAGLRRPFSPVEVPGMSSSGRWCAEEYRNPFYNAVLHGEGGGWPELVRGERMVPKEALVEWDGGLNQNGSFFQGRDSEVMMAGYMGGVGARELAVPSRMSDDALRTNETLVETVDEVYNLDSTRHSFDVARVAHGGMPQVHDTLIKRPPSVPVAPNTPTAGRDDYRSTGSRGVDVDVHLKQFGPGYVSGKVQSRIPTGRQSRRVGSNSVGPSGLPMIPGRPAVVPPLRLGGDHFQESSMSQAPRVNTRQGFKPEYDMFDRHRPNCSRDSLGSLNMIGSLAKVWSVNPNQNGSRAYHCTEVPISDTGSLHSRWESEILSECTSMILDSTVVGSFLDTNDYLASDANVYSTFQSIAENPASEDEYMANIRQALRNAEIERMESPSSTEASHLSRVNRQAFHRSLRDAHCASMAPQSVLIRTRTASPAGCFIPLPCVHPHQHKDISLLPNIVHKLGKSITRSKKHKEDGVPEHKRKRFSGFRKLLARASNAILGRKSDGSQGVSGWCTSPPLEPVPRMLALPPRDENCNFRIQSTIESWHGHALREPGHEDGPQPHRSVSDWPNLCGADDRSHPQCYKRPNRDDDDYVPSLIPRAECPSMGSLTPYGEDASEPDSAISFDPYGLFDQTRKGIAQSAVPSEVEAMEGLWILDKSRSEKVDSMCSALALDATRTKFWKNLSHIKIQVLGGFFRVSMKVPGVFEKTERVSLNGKESFPPRCDHLDGTMCLSASLPTRGFLTLATWDHPHPGVREEHYWMEDENRRLCIAMNFDYKKGRSCRVKLVFKRSK